MTASDEIKFGADPELAAALREIRQRRSDLVKVECSRDTGQVPPDNVEVVRRLFEAWNRRDYSAALALIDPEVEVEVSASGLELQGTQRGHAGLTEWMAAFWDNFDSPRAEIDEYVANGDDVVVTAHFYGRGKTSGAEVEMRRGQVYTLRDGKVVRWRHFTSRLEALEAVGLPADSLTDD
jgi:uncharacterized protein